MRRYLFPAKSVRRIPDPHEPTQNCSKYMATVDVRVLPDDFPMETNPRFQNLNNKVSRQVRDSLLNRDSNFYLLNRGITLSAAHVHYNNKSQMLEILMTDPEKHGCVDGGHTLKIILEHRNEIEEDISQHVQLEILTNVEDIYEDLAGARNTSNQVQDKSLAELRDRFDIIKSALEHEPYISNIGYKENDDKEIDVVDIVRILTMFNIQRFSSKSHPVMAFSSKKRCIDAYLADYDDQGSGYRKLMHIMPDIFRFYDYVESQLPAKYNEGGGRYGAVKGVVYKDNKEFHRRVFSGSGQKMAYESPQGFLYPIVAAFRALVIENPQTGFYEWKNGLKPWDLFDKIGSEMITKTVKQSQTLGNNPGAVGKDSNHWDNLYKDVFIESHQFV